LTVTGLSAGTYYYFSVVANAVGAQPSAAGTALARTAYAAPGAVTGVAATAQSTSSVLLNWTAAAANGSASLTGYTVTCTPSCTIASQPGANATSVTVTGLSAGTNYSFSVVANASDSQNSSAATASARTAYAAPGAVTGVTAKQVNGKAVLAWQAPIMQGAGVASYKVTYVSAGKTYTKMVTGLTVTLTGLAKGPQSFVVVVTATDGQVSATARASVVLK